MRVRIRGGWVGAAVGLWLAFHPVVASALIEYGDARISGFIASQNRLLHDGFRHAELGSMRNFINFNLDYQLVRKGEALRRFRAPFIESAKFFVQYRGGYDPIYTLRGRLERRIESHLRKDFATENKLRDLYLDLVFEEFGFGRLSMRVGQQQTTWGEADVVRSLDVINPLDLRKSFLLGPDQPNLNEFRIPLWMLKTLYSWGQMGPLANNLLEFLWIPGDIEPLRGRVGEVLGLPCNLDRRPSTLPHRRVREPFEITRIGPGRTEIPAQVVVFREDQPGGPVFADLVWFHHKRFTTEPICGPPHAPPPQNDIPARDWIGNAEAGARYMAQVSPFGQTIDFSLNYFYTFSDIPAAFADFPAVADALFTSPDPFNPALSIGRHPDTGAGLTPGGVRDLGSQATLWVPAALWYPRTHIFGGTVTYNDFEWTGAIWRLEVSHQTRDPRITPRPPFLAEREGEFTFDDFSQNFRNTGRTTRMMLGSDLFRSYELLDPILGPGQPLFISGQWFLEYKEDVSNTLGTLLDVHDKQRRWNPLYTLLVQYFFKGGRWVPLLILIYDQDAKHFAVAPFLEYHPRDWLTVKVGQIWFTGSKLEQSSRFLHTFADRDETFLRVQYEF